MSPLNSNKLSFLFFLTNFPTSQQVKTILQSKFTNVQFFFFFFNLCTVYFPKNVHFLFLFFLMLCSTVFKFLFFSFLSFSMVLSLFSFFSFFYNKLLIHYFFNLISTSLCFYLNIITIGSCLPIYSISNDISIKQAWFINKTFSIIFFLLSASISTKAWLVSSTTTQH